MTRMQRVTCVGAMWLAVMGVPTERAVAEVVRVEITTRADLLGGQSFGTVGAYETIIGTIYFAIDPQNPANRIITDIGLAPRNADGHVEFHADLYMIKPKDMTRGNGTVFYEVSNRGRKGMLGRFNRAAGSVNPMTTAQVGDGFLMQHGFTLLWVGWQFDVPRRDGLVRLNAPVAVDGGNEITGLVRSEVVVAKRVADALLADRGHVAYEVADPSSSDNVMTVRAALFHASSGGSRDSSMGRSHRTPLTSILRVDLNRSNFMTSFTAQRIRLLLA